MQLLENESMGHIEQSELYNYQWLKSEYRSFGWKPIEMHDMAYMPEALYKLVLSANQKQYKDINSLLSENSAH